MEQDEAALVAEWKEKHQCVLRLMPNSAAHQLTTILRLAEEALASRKVVEAARAHVAHRIEVGCGYGSQSLWELETALVAALDALELRS